ncbi:MAG: hypothetical protein J0L52_03305 [Caulobacterales bacterium]|nr:hypothetical protein [Caulobacterales bacterium]
MSSSKGADVSSARPWASDALSWLIGPTSHAEFFERYYEQEALIVPRHQPDRFEPLLSIAHIDSLIASADLRSHMIDLADASRELDRDLWIMDGGSVDRAVIAHQHALGATIILQQLHQSDPDLAAFCRAMEQTFSCHVQTNIYLTPPSAQGFHTHYDNHDVFVLQVEGEKRWRLYGTPVTTPYRGEGFERGKYDLGEVTGEFVLRAGDCAYVPRGLVHDASTSGDGPSLHITCGLIVKTWAEVVLEAVSEVALSDPQFRRSLPPGYAHRDYDRGQARALFDQLMKRLPQQATMDNAFDLMVDGFIRSRDSDIAGAVVSGALPLDPDQAYVVKPLTPWRLAEDGEALVLIAPGGDLDIKAAEVEAYRRALSGQPFVMADLGLEDAGKMLRRLIAFGVIGPV